MICQRCQNQGDVGERFCRKCGSDLQSALPLPTDPHSLKRRTFASHMARSKDPDELAGNGIGSVFVGDGFLMVAVILSATSTSISSLLWLLLLIPAFFFFGKGFADVFQARQIRRRLKQMELHAASTIPELVHLVPRLLTFLRITHQPN
ncbi:MAG: hypothetical protein AABN95_07720 [Acidobacteriota bacterium]